MAKSYSFMLDIELLRLLSSSLSFLNISMGFSILWISFDFFFFQSNVQFLHLTQNWSKLRNFKTILKFFRENSAKYTKQTTKCICPKIQFKSQTKTHPFTTICSFSSLFLSLHSNRSLNRKFTFRLFFSPGYCSTNTIVTGSNITSGDHQHRYNRSCSSRQIDCSESHLWCAYGSFQEWTGT